MEDNSKTTNGVGDNSASFSEGLKERYEFMLDQGVRFLDRLSNLVLSAEKTLRTKGINGKNVVERAKGLEEANVDLQKLVKDTKHWHTVIETMKQGKDVHIQKDYGGCKDSKLEIVGGEAYDFGQYLVDKTYPSNDDGKKYIKKITGNDK